MNYISLRNYFKNEDFGFSDWLIRERNLAILGDEIGINLTNPRKEVRVGNFYCDMICEDFYNKRSVIIESQLTKTDHDHLGKMLTYAAITKSKVMVWLCENANDEHRMTARYIMENSDLEIYIVKIAVLKNESTVIVSLQCLEKPLKVGLIENQMAIEKRNFESGGRKESFLLNIEKHLKENNIVSAKIGRIAEGLIIDIGIIGSNLSIILSYKNKIIIVNIYIHYKEGLSEEVERLIREKETMLNARLGCEIHIKIYKSKDLYFGFPIITPNMENASYYDEYSERIVKEIFKFVEIVNELKIFNISLI